MDDELLEEAKELARKRGETLTALIDRGLRMVLAQQKEKQVVRSRVSLPVSKARGGACPGIDLDATADLLEAMGDRD